MMENKVNDEESKYPSVGLAYEFVKPSYDWMLNRIEAVNNKLQGLLTLATAITFSMPIFAKAIFDEVDFQSVLFYGAIVAYILFVGIGMFGIRMGKVKLVHPQKLYEQWLSDSTWEFRKDTIYFAGLDFEDNKKIIDKKSLLSAIMNIVLVGEILAFIFWIATAS
jgi:hypothetical protein